MHSGVYERLVESVERGDPRVRAVDWPLIRGHSESVQRKGRTEEERTIVIHCLCDSCRGTLIHEFAGYAASLSAPRPTSLCTNSLRPKSVAKL